MDPDPYQDFMDPQHCFLQHLEDKDDNIINMLYSLLREIHVDDEEPESLGAALLAAHQVVHPAAGLQLRQQATRTLVTLKELSREIDFKNLDENLQN
jgi:hypothetical protein